MKRTEPAKRKSSPRSNASDPRLQAFLKPSDVFTPIQFASSVFEFDPLDVDTLHAGTQATFERLVEEASTSRNVRHGRMMLVLGESGTGKTHLLRGFRRYVHEEAHGFVCYAHVNVATQDYERHLLKNLVASLSRPYSRPSGERTGLQQLAMGLANIGNGALRAQIDRLLNDTWAAGTKDTLAIYIQRVVDELLDLRELKNIDPDVVRVLLYGLHSAHGTMARVHKYLCCDYLNEHDRRCIGDVAPRVDRSDPGWMIKQLIRLAFAAYQTPVVFLLDQAEFAGADYNAAALSRALSALNGIVDEMPSAIAVIACLSDLYTHAHVQLSKSLLDRLEKHPSVQRLQLNRTLDEAQAIIAKRLAFMFSEAGVVHFEDNDIYPFRDSFVATLEGLRTRDILERCHDYHMRCVAKGQLLRDDDDGDDDDDEVIDAPSLDRVSEQWHDKLQESGIELPADDAGVVAAIVDAARGCATELGLTFEEEPAGFGRRIQLGTANAKSEIVVAVTNKSFHAGAFGKQIGKLMKDAKSAIPAALRTLPFPITPACQKATDKLIDAGGRRVYIDASTLLTLVAHQQFSRERPADELTQWRQRDRPISTLSPIRQLFDLDGLVATRTSPRALAKASRAA